MSKQEVIICQNFNTELSQKLSAHSYDKIFILTDEHTFRLCLPLLQDIALLKDAEQIVIGPEDVHKKLGDTGLCMEPALAAEGLLATHCSSTWEEVW